MKPREYFLSLYIILGVLLLESLSATAVNDGGDCTSGFMSLERISILLNRGYTLGINIEDLQVIIPGINFTCSGNIHSWIFGAVWNGHNESFTELQIWRSSGNGSYTKVGSTTIMTEENSTNLYEYPLSSPLPFQEGDILGFYQPVESMRQLEVLNEVGYGHRLYYMNQDDTAASELPINNLNEIQDQYHPLISVETDSPGCVHGFMSVERMRILLYSKYRGHLANERQQITPDVKFTCDGMITKWIIGARWSQDDTSYPELQLWRKTGNDTYQKINGTLITIETESADDVYEYDNFPPIPFQTGDILGAFIPKYSKLIFISEWKVGPTTHYIPSSNAYDTIDFHHFFSTVYHPMITVEILTTTSAADPTLMPSTTSTTATATATTVPTPPDVSTDSGSQSSLGVGVGVGVGAAVVLLVVVGVLGVGLFCVWRRRHTSKVELPGIGAQNNIVYESDAVGGNSNGLSKNEMEMSCNVAYDTTKSASFKGEDEYDYIDGNDIITTSSNEAYATTDSVPVSSNQAYGVMQY